MHDIETYTKTAGAYILYNGYFLFMVGFGNKEKDTLGIVRFGGHRENGESVVQCVIREIKEETCLDIELLDNQIVYIESIETCELKREIEEDNQNPVYVRVGKGNVYSVMYLAHGKGDLKPDMETQGILLLRKEDIQKICLGNITLREYKQSGGKIILAKPLPEDVYLTPFIQLLFLNKLFDIEPDIMEKFISSHTAV